MNEKPAALKGESKSDSKNVEEDDEDKYNDEKF
jgi:hypothetical protein